MDKNDSLKLHNHKKYNSEQIYAEFYTIKHSLNHEGVQLDLSLGEIHHTSETRFSDWVKNAVNWIKDKIFDTPFISTP